MITVIKLGGRVQSDPALIVSLAKRWHRAPGALCLVHGGGDEITALQRQLGREPSFVNGRTRRRAGLASVDHRKKRSRP
jgi:acetylglutamate kinase